MSSETPKPPIAPSTSDLWDHANPFVIELRVAARHIDALGHVNNVHYLSWLQQCAWEHSNDRGFSEARMVEIDRAMVVRTTTMNYLAAAFEDDDLWIGNWITASDGKLRARREFQIIRPADERTLMRAQVDYVCMRISTGKATRMPPEFKIVYAANINL